MKTKYNNKKYALVIAENEFSVLPSDYVFHAILYIFLFHLTSTPEYSSTHSGGFSGSSFSWESENLILKMKSLSLMLLLLL